MAKSGTKIRSMELKWEKEGKSKAEIRRLRYYYKNRRSILNQFKKNPTLAD